MTTDFTTRILYADRPGAAVGARRESMGPADPPVRVSSCIDALDDQPADFVRAFARLGRR